MRYIPRISNLNIIKVVLVTQLQKNWINLEQVVEFKNIMVFERIYEMLEISLGI